MMVISLSLPRSPYDEYRWIRFQKQIKLKSITDVSEKSNGKNRPGRVQYWMELW